MAHRPLAAMLLLLVGACGDSAGGADGNTGGFADRSSGFDGPRADGAEGTPDAPLADAALWDAPPSDAAPPDGPTPDAAPVLCGGPEDCAVPPGPCLLPGTCGSDGLCVFAPVDCSDLDDECSQGVCRAADGECVAQPIDEGDRCGGEPSCSTGLCSFADTCSESGTREVSCDDHACMAGVCTPVTTTSTEPCTRTTGGVTCGPTECGAPFGGCVFEGNPTCDQTGTRTTTCTPQMCSGGECAAGTPFPGSESCSRSTGGAMCAPTECGAPGMCGGFDTFCDITGTATRTCTDYACSGDGCVGTPRAEIQPCTRPSREGQECAPEECGGCELTDVSSCSSAGFINCDQFSCHLNVCIPGGTTMTPCTAPTDGLVCRAVICTDGSTRELCCVDGMCEEYCDFGCPGK